MTLETPECRVDAASLTYSGGAPIKSPDSTTSPVLHSPQPTGPPLRSLDHTFPRRIPVDRNPFGSHGKYPSPPVDTGHDDRIGVENTAYPDVAPVKPRKRLSSTVGALNEDLQETRSGKRLRRNVPEIETPVMSSRSTRQTSRTQQPTVNGAAPPKLQPSAVIKPQALKVTSKTNISPAPRLPKSNLGSSKGRLLGRNRSLNCRTYRQPVSSSGEEWEDGGSESEEYDDLWESDEAEDSIEV